MGRSDIIYGDRRTEKRYEYAMELRFTYREAGVTKFGSGCTVELSRSAVRFLAENPPPKGADIELRIAWPYLLQNVCPLELVVRGSVLRNTARGTILEISDHEFRTCGQRSFDQPLVVNAGNSFIA